MSFKRLSLLIMICESFVNLVLISVAASHRPIGPIIDNSVGYHHDYSGDYEDYPSDQPNDYNPNPIPSSDPERITFDGIYERRKKFDVQTPMGYPKESNPESPELHEDRHHHYEPTPDYPGGLNIPVFSNDGPPTPHHLESDDHSDDHSDHHSDQHSDHHSDPHSDPHSDDYPSESQTETQSKPSFLTDGCLRCLCEASSDCDPQVRCHVEGPTDYKCGPFQVSTNYWSDAGSPGADHNDPLDFEECMNDIECSIDTVNGYMKLHQKDCDGDGRVSCDDYAKIHMAGAQQCNSSWIVNTPFWHKYKDCYFEYK